MFEDIQLISTSVNIYRFLALLYTNDWRRYALMLLTNATVLFEGFYVLLSDESINNRILNSYTLVLWLTSILRPYSVIYYRSEYEELLGKLELYFKELYRINDSYIQRLLQEANQFGRFMGHLNLFLGILTCLGITILPLLNAERALPYGCIIPGFNKTFPYETPYFEIIYILHTIATPMGCCMYIPFTTLIVAFNIFGIVMCKALQRRLRTIKQRPLDNESIKREVIASIKYHQRIIDYVEDVNRLITQIFFIEFMAFGILLCALLFLLAISDEIAQTITVFAYISMTFTQILALYWYANELREQNLSIASAAYDTEWFTYPIPVQKCILFLIIRAQKPVTTLVGNTYAMTLELFQKLLNASYRYFALLRNVYT